MNLLQEKRITLLKKRLFSSLTYEEIRSFKNIYSALSNPYYKDRAHRQENSYRTFLSPRNNFEKSLITRIYKEKGCYNSFIKDLKVLKIRF
jgi:hypothetical protein